jgi:hypothetical protein
MILIISIIVLLVVLIGIYLATRTLPQPWSPTTTCKIDSDCPKPSVCNLTTHLCNDPQEAVLLTAAQTTTAALYNALQIIIMNFKDIYPTHLSVLLNGATAMNLSIPSTASLYKNLAAGLNDLNKYIEQVLIAPNCTANCGYYTEIMTAASSQKPIWSIASNASSLIVELPIATGAFAPLVGDMSTVVSMLTAEAQANMLQPTTAASEAINAVNADIAQINGYEATLTQLATVAATAGKTLYHHYMNY